MPCICISYITLFKIFTKWNWDILKLIKILLAYIFTRIFVLNMIEDIENIIWIFSEETIKKQADNWSRWTSVEAYQFNQGKSIAQDVDACQRQRSEGSLQTILSFSLVLTKFSVVKLIILGTLVSKIMICPTKDSNLSCVQDTPPCFRILFPE